MNSTATVAIAHPALTPEHVAKAKLVIDQSTRGALGAIKGVSESQWTFKPAPDRWSIAEIVEHVVFLQERVLGPIRDLLATAPPPPSDYDVEAVDAIIIHQFPTRLVKVKGPEFANPTGCMTKPDAIARLEENDARLKRLVETGSELRQHAIEGIPLKITSNGAYGLMDGYQWILAAAAHTDRHTKQILEVKADPAFPQD